MTLLLPAFTGAPEVGKVYHTDALTLLKAMPDASVDLIATDPPFNIGKASWDSWASLDSYLAWLDEHLREMRRVLKPNGSLYLFAATKYSARVELAVSAHFNVLNAIRWRKPEYSTKAEMFDKDTMRAFFPASETVIFAEHNGVDYLSNGLAFAPLKGWFRSRALQAGITSGAFNEALGFATTGSGVAGSVIGAKEEFIIVSAETYERIQMTYPGVFERNYFDIRHEYEALKCEYEDLRRPFNATAEAPYTDVWDFATVNTYPGKHICEKPLAMCQHIVSVSSRPDALVFDPFCGSGNMLRAAWLEGRRYIGGDADLHWVERSRERLRMPFEKRQRATVTQFSDLPLFAATE